MHIRRADCVTLAVFACMPISPQRSSAFDLQSALALAPLYQMSTAIDDIDIFLFGSMLDEKQPAAGVQAETGATARKMIAKILKEGRIRELSHDATSAGLQASRTS